MAHSVDKEPGTTHPSSNIWERALAFQLVKEEKGSGHQANKQ